MEEENRRESLAESLQPLLEEGEQYKVFCHEGKVYVEDEATSACAVRHPRLYGRLLATSTQLEQAGDGLGRIPTLLAVTFCVGLQLRWWKDWLGWEPPIKLDEWYFYLLVFLVLFQGLGWINRVLQRRLYQRNRDELFALLAQEGQDRDLLVALIEGDPAVERIATHLKLDLVAPSKESPR